MADERDGLFGELPDLAPASAARGGLPRLRRAERGQIELRTLSLDDLIPADHRARMVCAFVERLDLSALYGAIRSVEGGPGHPPADPRMLMALWLYATVEGVGERASAGAAPRRAPRLSMALRRREREAQDARGFPRRSRAAAGAAAGRRLRGAARLGRGEPRSGGARHGMRVRASAGAASFRRRCTLETCRVAAEAEVARLARELEADPAGVGRRARAAQARAAAERQARVEAAIEARSG